MFALQNSKSASTNSFVQLVRHKARSETFVFSSIFVSLFCTTRSCTMPVTSDSTVLCSNEKSALFRTQTTVEHITKHTPSSPRRSIDSQTVASSARGRAQSQRLRRIACASIPARPTSTRIEGCCCEARGEFVEVSTTRYEYSINASWRSYLTRIQSSCMRYRISDFRKAETTGTGTY